MTTPATTPLTYNGYVTAVGTMAVLPVQTVGGIVSTTDTQFNAVIPQMLNYAELRIQRDLDLLQSQVENTSYSLSSGGNLIQIGINDFVTIQTFSVINGTARTPLLPVTKQYIQNVYPDSTTTGQPAYFAMYGGDAATYGDLYQNVIVGPYPDKTYSLVLTGTIRLQSLNANSANSTAASTNTTWISTYLPDLLLQASMIFISQYQRNFGPTRNDPQMGPSYEAQYQTLLKGATVEEARKKFQSTGWASESPAVVATPSRG
jgi:hypothetical protein